jgi:ATP-dependent exoDNAse (exonuclease V) alpha subunit
MDAVTQLSPDLAPDLRSALDAIQSLDPAVFVLGRAGTGKTWLLRYVASRCGRQNAIVAPTGLAALNAGGQTIHSFFGIAPFGVGPQIEVRRLRKKLLKALDLLLVDEVSMVRVDLLDAMDKALRAAREVDAPFGDVQVVFFGDFLQLPPVVTANDGQILHELGYPSPYAFDARVLRDLSPTYVEMTEVRRQEDAEFIHLLGRLRSGEQEAVAEINARCVGPHRASAAPILLTSTNRLADLYNARGLQSLPGASNVIEGRLSEKFGQDRLPAPQMLELKPRARVMAVRNDPQGRFVNGSLGTVTAIDNPIVSVLFDGRKEAVDIEPVTWESIRYDMVDGKVSPTVIGSYRQSPLMPAWAITIHKAQGLTLEDVRVDLGGGAFASGQAYVALSRARTIEGLSLARPLTPRDLVLDPALERFV